MGDVLELPVARSRSARDIVDRMARAIAHEKGRNFHRMTWARQEQLRKQARAALRAFRPDDVTADQDIEVACAVYGESVAEASPSESIVIIQAWVDEVLQ